MNKEDLEREVKRLVIWLKSDEGKLALAKAQEATRLRLQEIEKASRITDPLFFFKRVTI